MGTPDLLAPDCQRGERGSCYRILSKDLSIADTVRAAWWAAGQCLAFGVEDSPRDVANFDSLSDLDRQQIFSPLKRAGIRLPGLRHHVFGVGSM